VTCSSAIHTECIVVFSAATTIKQCVTILRYMYIAYLVSYSVASALFILLIIFHFVIYHSHYFILLLHFLTIPVHYSQFLLHYFLFLLVHFTPYVSYLHNNSRIFHYFLFLFTSSSFCFVSWPSFFIYLNYFLFLASVV
jgi:hypothetical protein